MEEKIGYDGFSENYFIDFADVAIARVEDGLEDSGDYAYAMILAEKGGGLGAAKYLHFVNSHWNEIDHGKETFIEFATRKVYKNKYTVIRRVCSWEFLESYVPSHHKEAFLRNWDVGMFSRGYRIAVKHRANKFNGNLDYLPSGLEIEKADWLALSECVDLPGLIDVKSRIDGKEPNKNRVAFTEKDGAIWFHRGKKDSAQIGVLYCNLESELVQDGITELLEKIGAK